MNTKGMKQIGKGHFSTVYQSTKNKVLIKSRDSVKECMSLGWFPSSPLFPEIKRIGSSDCGNWQFYEEKFYPKVKGLKNILSKFEYEFYIALKSIEYTWGLRDCDRADNLREKFNNLPNKFHHKKNILLEAIDGLSNYGQDMCFEISPRNVATQGNKLVLLDCFFFQSEIKR